MKSKEKIKRFFKQAELNINPDKDEKIFQDVFNAQQKTTKNKPARPVNIREIIMTNPVTKIATAAIVAIAFIIGISFWKSTGSGITLAEVLEELERVTTYSYQTSTTLTRPEGREESISNVLVSQDHGVKMTMRTIDPNGQPGPPGDTYLLPQQNLILFVTHANKVYTRMSSEDSNGLASVYRKEDFEPHVIVSRLLDSQHIRLGESMIDGKLAEGFQTRDLSYGGGFTAMSDWMGPNREVDVTLWVDAQTRLPVRLVENIVKTTDIGFHEITDDFRWNIPVTDYDFDPNIPSDYTNDVGDIVMIDYNQENAIKGLRLFADLLGKYPASLDVKDRKEIITDELRRLAGHDDSFDSLSDDEKAKVSSKITLLSTAMIFYWKLDDDKNKAYYGETVEPGDSSKVLLRWKLDDGQYRVIFGDLSVRTVTTEELDELEANI